MIAAWCAMKTGIRRQRNESAYRPTEDIRRIFGFGAQEIDSSQDEQTLQLFVDGRSYRLSELGSGLTQFFLAPSNAASSARSYILIDEPELNLASGAEAPYRVRQRRRRPREYSGGSRSRRARLSSPPTYLPTRWRTYTWS